ncbi:hypothetical protein ACHAWF_001293 [Thalassiosira exigua]
MVVLEAAVITAGGVAAYKGGKAAAEATAKSVKSKMKLSGQEKERKETFTTRKQERKERFSQINAYRTSLKDVDGNKGGGVTIPSFNWKSDSSKSASKAPHASRSHSAQSSSSSWWGK